MMYPVRKMSDLLLYLVFSFLQPILQRAAEFVVRTGAGGGQRRSQGASGRGSGQLTNRRRDLTPRIHSRIWK